MFITAAAAQRGQPSPFLLVPLLAFEFDGTGTRCAGRVQILRTSPMNSQHITDNYFASVGGLIALCTWFGLGDLHWENIFSGETAEGQTLLSPVDIECIFDHVTLPSQTSLLPSNSVGSPICGLSVLANFLTDKGIRPNAAAICEGYLAAISLLSASEDHIIEILHSLSAIYETPIRSVLRPTREYRDWQAHKMDESVFCEDELRQLRRGDIPYFFRYLAKPKLFFYGDQGAVMTANLTDELAGKFNELASTILTEKKNHNDVTTLTKAGALQVAKFFQNEGTTQTDRTSIVRTSSHLFLKTDGMKLQCAL
jgi:hypothetical protein